MFQLELAWLSIGVIALLVVVMLLILQTGRYQQRLVFRFWQEVGLPLGTDSVAAAVRRRIRFRSSAALDVGFSLRESLFRQGKDSPRLARSRVTSLRDYLSPWRLRLAPAFSLIAAVLCAVGMLLGLLGLIDVATFIRSPALPLLAVALLVFFVGMAAERRVLGHPQPATDTLELAWDDAFKADTFRVLRVFATIVAWLAVAAAGIGMLQGLDAITGTSWSTGVGPQLFIWGYLATLSSFSFGRAKTYFRHHLWPDLAEVNVGNTTGSN